MNSLFEECEARGADCAKNKRRAPVRSTGPGHFTILNIFLQRVCDCKRIKKKNARFTLARLLFFSVFGGVEVASREGRETLELAAIDEKDARR